MTQQYPHGSHPPHPGQWQQPQPGTQPQQPGYQPQPPGYPPQAQPPGYPPQAPPQHPGYPPQGQPPAYPPQAQPQHPGYPPQAQPQHPGYPPQAGHPQQAGYPPPQQTAYGAAPAAVADYGAPEDPDAVASEASPKARAKFIERTYLHLALAIAVFVGLLTVLVNLPGIENLVALMIGTRASWGVVLVVFMGVAWIADKWSRSSTGLGMQYAGLILYTIAEAVIFVPLVYLARQYVGTEAIVTAGGITLAMFAAMTLYVFVTRKDFSAWRGMLAVLTMAALGLVAGSLIFGFSLGIAFSVGMIALASGYILFYTSNVLHHYRVTQHVAAALALFSAVALLFWYVLRLIMQMRR